jgi:GAF domain-containing protein
VQDLPQRVQDLLSEPQPTPSQETTPPAGADSPAAWEKLTTEFGANARGADAQEVSAMNTIFNEIMRPATDADRVFELVAEQTANLTGATGSAIALAERGHFVCRARFGSTAPERGTRLDPGTGLSGLCVRTGHMLRCDDAERDPRVSSDLTRETGIRSVSVVPLIKDGRLVGVFELLSTRAHAFEKKEIEILQRMSKLVMLTMSRVGELRGERNQRRARTRWLQVLGLAVLAFLLGFGISRLLGPILLGH